MFSRQKFPELVTGRLILEPFNSRHSDGVFALWSSPEVCMYSGDAYDWDGNLIRLPARSPSDSDLISSSSSGDPTKAAVFVGNHLAG